MIDSGIADSSVALVQAFWTVMLALYVYIRRRQLLSRYGDIAKEGQDQCNSRFSVADFLYSNTTLLVVFVLTYPLLAIWAVMMWQTGPDGRWLSAFAVLFLFALVPSIAYGSMGSKLKHRRRMRHLDQIHARILTYRDELRSDIQKMEQGSRADQVAFQQKYSDDNLTKFLSGLDSDTIKQVSHD